MSSLPKGGRSNLLPGFWVRQTESHTAECVGVLVRRDAYFAKRESRAPDIRNRARHEASPYERDFGALPDSPYWGWPRQFSIDIPPHELQDRKSTRLNSSHR